MKVLAHLSLAALAIATFVLVQPAHAQWMLGSVTYPDRAQPQPGSTYAQSASRPQLTTASQGTCSTNGSTYISINGAVQTFFYLGGGTPPSYFYVDVTCYADGSASGTPNVTPLWGTSGSGVTVQQTDFGGQAPPNYPADGSSQSSSTDTYRVDVTGQYTASSYDMPINISAYSSLHGSMGCYYQRDYPGNSTASSWVVFSNIQSGGGQIGNVPQWRMPFSHSAKQPARTANIRHRNNSSRHEHRLVLAPHDAGQPVPYFKFLSAD